MKPRIPVALLAGAGIAAALPASLTSIWPMPQIMTTSGNMNNITLSPALALQCSNLCPDPLPAAFLRYNDIIFFAGEPGIFTGPQLQMVIFNVTAQAPLKYGVSENYTLNIPANGGTAVITADTQWGALRALESLSQLVVWSTAGDANVYAIYSTPISIVDYPRFMWRSMLIDTSRHYLTVSSILSTLDAMSYNKLNRLHWHIVDDNSWPLYSENYPLFTNGAYAPNAIYTRSDVAQIVQYAYERGISVIPELDMPAHSYAWSRGYPALEITCAGGQPLLNPLPNGGLYDTIKGLLSEFVPELQTDYIHFGGDEVNDLTCWAQDAGVQAFMKAQGYTNVSQVRNYFESQLQSIAASYNLSAVFWEEVFDDGFDVLPSTIIDVWLSDAELQTVITSGQRAIASYGYYLDQQTPPGQANYFWADTWQNFYLQDALFGVNVTAAQAANWLGISISQWGEQCDASNIHSRMWPRASGGAERAWSNATVRDTGAALPRLEALRCHMVQRGIGAGPLRPADQMGYCELPASSRFNRMHHTFAVPARG